MTPQYIPLVLVKWEDMEDWYTIERKFHDGKEEWVPYYIKNSSGRDVSGRAFIKSSRLGVGDNNYCIEGTKSEMLHIAKAIEEKSEVNFTRCSVVTTNDGYEFSSPRNSIYPVKVTIQNGLDLAKDIRSKLSRDSW